jgi:fibronectin type 3 domain-containing protein
MIHEITDPTITTYSDMGLDAGDYDYHVTAVYDEGESDPSNTESVTITLPAPANFNAVSQGPAQSTVMCTWAAPAATRNLSEYKIYRDGTELGTTTALFYADLNVPTGDYTYHVTAIYSDTYESAASNQVTVQHTDAPTPLVPTVTALSGNYPNPFNPSTDVKFSLKEAADVQIDIFNIKGEKVKTLVNDHMEAAYHSVTWNGNDDQGRTVGSGIYFYKMRAGKYTSTKKMILMK